MTDTPRLVRLSSGTSNHNLYSPIGLCDAVDHAEGAEKVDFCQTPLARIMAIEARNDRLTEHLRRQYVVQLEQAVIAQARAEHLEQELEQRRVHLADMERELANSAVMQHASFGQPDRTREAMRAVEIQRDEYQLILETIFASKRWRWGDLVYRVLRPFRRSQSATHKP
jgi:hypothetical protein